MAQTNQDGRPFDPFYGNSSSKSSHCFFTRSFEKENDILVLFLEANVLQSISVCDVTVHALICVNFWYGTVEIGKHLM